MTISTSVALVAALMLLATEVYSGADGQDNTAQGQQETDPAVKVCFNFEEPEPAAIDLKASNYKNFAVGTNMFFT